MNNYFIYDNPIFLKHIDINAIENVLELGTYDGSYTAAINSTFNPKKIYSLEANPKMEKIILENQKNLTNVEFYLQALWGEKTELDFYLFKDEYGSSSFFEHPDGFVEKVKIKTETLDSFIKSKNINKIDLILADVEGAEANIFKNQKSLQNVRYIIAECKFQKNFKGEHFPDLDDLKKSLNPLGFELVESIGPDAFKDTLWINKFYENSNTNNII